MIIISWKRVKKRSKFFTTSICKQDFKSVKIGFSWHFFVFVYATMVVSFFRQNGVVKKLGELLIMMSIFL